MDQVHHDVAEAIWAREQTDPHDAALMRQYWDALCETWTPGLPLDPRWRHVLLHVWGVPEPSLNAKAPGVTTGGDSATTNTTTARGGELMVSPAQSNGQHVDLAGTVGLRVGVLDAALGQPWDMAVKWYDAGWPVHPLPYGVKSPPLSGFTGYQGRNADREEVLAWPTCERAITQGEKYGVDRWNIGLRAPVGTVGIDVDAYDKVNKRTGEITNGGVTLAAFEAAHGRLPDTYRTQGRRDEGSGIRWLENPSGALLDGVVGPGIEVIQPHHRYAAAWPSWHAEAGVVYRTLDPDGNEVKGPMCRPEDLPELPEEWLAALRKPEGFKDRKPRARKTKAAVEAKPRREAVSKDVVDEWLAACVDPDGEMHTPVRKALDNAVRKGDEGISRHDTCRDLVWELVNLGGEGCHGLGKAYDQAESWFAEVTADEPGRDGFEFDRMVNGAITKVGLRDEDDEPCDCDEYAAFDVSEEPVEGAARTVRLTPDERAERAKRDHEAGIVPTGPLTKAERDVQKGKDPKAASTQGRRTLVATRVSDIPMEAVHWLWDGRVPLGEITLVAGKPDVGKSTCSYTLAAQITRGTLPGRYFGEPRDVLVVTSEESFAHAIRPRLIAAGADLDRVWRIEAKTSDGVGSQVDLPQDLHNLEAMIEEKRAVLVLLDPLLSRLSSKLDTHKDAEVRLALEPIKEIADRTRCGVIGLIHLNKSGKSDPLDQIMGSVAFGAVVRSIVFIMRDPDNEDIRLLGVPKHNLSAGKEPTLEFRIDEAVAGYSEAGDEVTTGKLVWTGERSQSIRELLESSSEEPETRSATREAADWLRDYLQLMGGRCEAPIVKREGLKEGHTARTLQRAHKRAKVKTTREGFPCKGYWALTDYVPEETPKPSDPWSG